MTTTRAEAARRVTYQLETLWDYDYVPTHEELATLYETAKKNQWNASTAILSGDVMLVKAYQLIGKSKMSDRARDEELGAYFETGPCFGCGQSICICEDEPDYECWYCHEEPCRCQET